MQASDADMIWQSVCTRTNDIIQFGGSNTLCAAAATDNGSIKTCTFFYHKQQQRQHVKGGSSVFMKWGV